MPDRLQITVCDYTNPDHLNALVDLINASILENHPDKKPFTGFERLRLVDAINQNENNVVMLAILNQSVIACAIAYECLDVFTGVKYLQLHDVIILNRYEGLDIDQMLIKGMKEIAEARNYPLKRVSF